MSKSHVLCLKCVRRVSGTWNKLFYRLILCWSSKKFMSTEGRTGNILRLDSRPSSSIFIHQSSCKLTFIVTVDQSEDGLRVPESQYGFMLFNSNVCLVWCEEFLISFFPLVRLNELNALINGEMVHLMIWWRFSDLRGISLSHFRTSGGNWEELRTNWGGTSRR